MRVLLVAPRTNLLLADEEVQDVLRSGLTVTPVIGSVTATELLREIKAGQHDILWLATHGDSAGIQLSDGPLSAPELVAQVRERFKLVVLNTCGSFLIAQQLQEEANVAVIATLVDIPDRQAYQTGSLLASALVESPSIAAAYKRSKPGGNRIYLYLPALQPAEDIIESLLIELRELRTRLERADLQLQRADKERDVTRWLILAGFVMTWAAMYAVWVGM